MKGLTREQRRQLKADIVEYRKQGHYVSECAEHFGVKISYVHMACHGIDFPWKYDTDKMSQAAKEQHKNIRANPETAIKHINKSAPWCEYVDGYETWDCYINVRCKTCGSIINISFITIRGGTSKCPRCEKVRIQKAHEKAEQERKAKAEQRQFAKISNMKCAQMKLQVCAYCGKLFVQTGYRTKFCTDVCLKKSNNAITKDRRVRKINSNERDNDITLERLYQRFGGVCAICGGVCDWNNFHVIDGTFIADNNYPSIDHIMPLSKGGKHKWSNVQLAHRICNTKKGNSIALPVETI